MWTRSSNTCATCGIQLTPSSIHTFTAHEFHCYKAHPTKIPERDIEQYQHELRGEMRREAGKKGAQTRRLRKARGDYGS